ncbi:hypothetical protein F0562_014185 [Nyssa sinensis]|uniref:Uncharacterized protein n=1 Tax=Nyssa sinensis TaxID=561372 RepID=A0A5J4ZMN1_9ASTE|nr:hypothetical protein F0562_014185 [Nyssa sinensis]
MAEDNGGNQRQVSGNAEMAGEVEQYLLDKIRDAIKEAESAEQHLLVKLVPLRSQFLNLKNLLAPSPPADGSKLSREKLYYLDNLLTEWLMLSKKQSSYSPQALNFAININSSLKKINKELRLGDANGAPNRTDIPQPTGEASAPKKLETYRWSTRSVDTSKVHGLDHEVMSLERLLVLRRQSVDQFKADWDCRDGRYRKNNTLPGTIHQARTEESLPSQDLGAAVCTSPTIDGGLPKGHGGTVIVTSRSEEVAKNMVGEENLIRLRPVRDQESCWLIFKDTVEKDGTQFPSDLKYLQAEIVKKCAGLPLAAKMMGQIKHEQLQQEAAASESQPDANHQALQ